ncbi:MAG: diacylglycerol kinase family lipid kinase [Deltaproteobacteria bacterium]|nr:diacylglycerol kinase family lipid kinase [Deltaproteobacteria bacterium]
MAPAPKTFVVVNPRSGGSRGRHLWPRLADQLHRTLGPFDFEFTNAGGAGTILATQAIAQGYRRLIAVGGDGTVNEVLNGVMTEDGQILHPDVTLAAIPTGSGTDYWRSLGLPEEPFAALKYLNRARLRHYDIGRVALHTHDGHALVRYFCNVADVGLGGDVVDRAKKLPSWGQGTINYCVGAIGAFWQWGAPDITLAIDDEPETRQPITTVIVAIGQYCGGGMHVAPRAKLDDGRFDLVVVGALSRWCLLELLPKLYTGKLDRQEQIGVRTAHTLTLHSSHPVRITLDGEIAGQLPAQFQLLPRVLPILA